MTSRHAKFTGKRIVGVGRFLQDILNLGEHALALVNNFDASIKGILAKELSFLTRLHRLGKILKDLAEESDIFGDITRLLRMCVSLK